MSTTERKRKEDKPVLAICYDFDKTLSPDDMQAQGYIQAVYDGDVSSFWKEANKLAEENEMDGNLAYMYMMVQEARGRILLTRRSLEDYGSKVKLFPGVEGWFERIREYGRQKGVIVEHYIISSGLKEMIEGTAVAKAGAFEKIYASSFYFDEKGVPVWPAQVVNFTNKTQFLFRIEKGTLDVNDSSVNESFSPEDLRVPFRNMVYIGDSDTDIPCMKLVNTYGGHSIGVYNKDTADKTKVYKMLRDNRIKYFASADYSQDSELDGLVKAIIDRTLANEVLEGVYYKCKDECGEKRTKEIWKS
ncbi:MAG: haloacid dehalogenase-like hydrolase [Lachnospiraceae bacterium]|nr:haloacid dehalogenase-like hydrolase [Lachnospiraceae bacterium]